MENINQLFTEYLKEDSDYPTTYGLPKVGPTDGVISADDESKAPYQVASNPEMLNKVNAWLASLTTRPYINAYTVSVYLKQKLAITGLDFKEPKFEGESGHAEVDVTQWGNPTDLKLHFDWVRVRGWYTISAQLEKSVQPQEPIAEDELKEGEDVDEGTSPLSVLNNLQKRRKKDMLNTNRYGVSGKRINLSRLLTSAAGKLGYALKAALGTGGYTHTQGRKNAHIHAKALKGKALLKSSKPKKMLHN